MLQGICKKKSKPLSKISTVEPHLTDTPEKWPSTIHFGLVRMDLCICLCTIQCGTPPNPVKWTGSPVPTLPELYKIHSKIQMLVYHFHKIVRHIQRSGIIYSLSLIMLTFLNLENIHCAHQPNYTLPCTLEAYWKTLKYRYLHIMVSALEELHCILSTVSTTVLTAEWKKYSSFHRLWLYRRHIQT